MNKIFSILLLPLIISSAYSLKSLQTAHKYTIESVISHKCLDAYDGISLIQYLCHGNSIQIWTIEEYSGKYLIKNDWSGKCLEVVESSVVQHECWFTTESQLWKIIPKGDGYNLINSESKLCLTVENNSNSDLKKIIQIKCKDGDEKTQIWKLNLITD